MSTPPVPRKSGRAPKSDRLGAIKALVEPLEPSTLAAVNAAVFLQNQRGAPGLKSRHLTRIATDLELALIEKRPKDETDRLCLDVAATALRILEQGD